MKIWQILRSLERLEDRMANLYEAVRQRYSADRQTASLFAQLRDEELGHRDIVRYQQRILFRAADNYTDLPDYDVAGLEQSEHAVEELLAREAGLSLEELLRSVVALECSATEQHYRSVLGQASPALGDLVIRLGDGDQAHAAKLARFARARGMDSSPRPA